MKELMLDILYLKINDLAIVSAVSFNRDRMQSTKRYPSRKVSEFTIITCGQSRTLCPVLLKGKDHDNREIYLLVGL